MSPLLRNAVGGTHYGVVFCKKSSSPRLVDLIRQFQEQLINSGVITLNRLLKPLVISDVLTRVNFDDPETWSHGKGEWEMDL